MEPKAEYVYVPDWAQNRAWFEDRSAPPPAYVLLRQPPPWVHIGIELGTKTAEEILNEYVASCHFTCAMQDGSRIEIRKPSDLLNTSAAFLVDILGKVATGPEPDDADREAALRAAGLLAPAGRTLPPHVPPGRRPN